ncbi:TetR/AcrR family transcriptional regulator [Ferdinandcohnia quinoae]|uniref:TetR/AcrR family transcriptional regulator n=1 Tax=Fredinandcohnia quinoae TaxID=2918902 RepID=A0AAW5EF50_9BACI|nr:TetR/AcrR family transcriptional regulator [Fredinandcohnia sp. SECRCQ15]MCH1627813.1 TetR/AcrR family transcriptional regulator [Fredinandcohnia sp. SECRCQ15]
MSEQEWLKEIFEQGKKDQKVSEKQIKIIEAAVEIFSEKGYAAASTSEIAKKAGVAEGTIFRHYRTKKDLLYSIITPTLLKIVFPVVAKTFIKQVLVKHEDLSFDEIIRKMLFNRYNFVKNNTPLLKIILQEIAFHDEMKMQFQEAFMDHAYNKLIEVVEYYQAKGEIIDIPTKSVIRMVVTTIFGFLIMRFIIVPESEWNDEEEIELTIQFIMNGLSKK